MRVLQILSVIAIILGIFSGCFQKEELPEITTIIRENPGSPVVTFNIRFMTGSAKDPSGKAGLNRLLARTIINGGTGELSYREIIDRLYPMAARIDVIVDKEATTFIGEVHKDFLLPFYEIFSSLILKPSFNEEDFNREKDQQISYIENYLRSANDEELGKQALVWFIYRNHPYGLPVAGTVTQVKSITLSDVKNFYYKNYIANSLVIGIGGDVSKEFVERVKTDFSNLPNRNPDALVLPAVEKIGGIEVLLIEKDVKSSAISLGFPLNITRSDSEYYPLYLANSYLGEHRTFTGRLMKIMRETRGLNYGDYSYIEHFQQQGWSVFPSPHYPRHQQYFSIWIRPVLMENAHFALRQAIRELERMIKEGLTAEEFQSTKEFLLNYSKLYAQTQSVQLGFELDSFFYGRPYWIEEIDKQLRSLKLEDVNRAIRHNLQARRIKVVMVVNDAASFKEKLETNARSPIVYQTEGTKREIRREDKLIEKYKLNVSHVEIIPVDKIFD